MNTKRTKIKTWAQDHIEDQVFKIKRKVKTTIKPSRPHQKSTASREHKIKNTNYLLICLFTWTTPLLIRSSIYKLDCRLARRTAVPDNRNAMRPLLLTKAAVEAETSTLINKRLCNYRISYWISLSFNLWVYSKTYALTVVIVRFNDVALCLFVVLCRSDGERISEFVWRQHRRADRVSDAARRLADCSRPGDEDSSASTTTSKHSSRVTWLRYHSLHTPPPSTL